MRKLEHFCGFFSHDAIHHHGWNGAVLLERIISSLTQCLSYASTVLSCCSHLAPETQSMERNSRREIKQEQDAGIGARWGGMSGGAGRNGVWILIDALPQPTFESVGPVSFVILLPLRSLEDGGNQRRGLMMWVVRKCQLGQLLSWMENSVSLRGFEEVKANPTLEYPWQHSSHFLPVSEGIFGWKTEFQSLKRKFRSFLSQASLLQSFGCPSMSKGSVILELSHMSCRGWSSFFLGAPVAFIKCISAATTHLTSVAHREFTLTEHLLGARHHTRAADRPSLANWLPVFVNNALLEQGQGHLFTCCL